MAKVLFYCVPFTAETAACALECGAHALIVPSAAAKDAADLDHVRIFEAETFSRVPLANQADLEYILSLPANDNRVTIRTGWNAELVAVLLEKHYPVRAEAGTVEEAAAAASLAGRGVDAIIVLGAENESIRTIVAAGLMLPDEPLIPAEITNILTFEADECFSFDTFSMFAQGQGALVGTSGFMFLVHADTQPGADGEAHPFRIHAGVGINYIKLPGSKACPVSAVRSGTRIVSADCSGKVRRCIVGTVRKTPHPIVMIEATLGGNRPGSLLIQYADRICLTDVCGVPRSVTALKPGDRVLCRTIPVKAFTCSDAPGEQDH